MTDAAVLEGFEKIRFKAGKWTRDVYKRGSGPAVIVIHEIPGLHPLVLAFAERVAAAGMTVYCPSLFGTPGKPASRGYALAEVAKAFCVRREFYFWARDRSSPIVDWLRALARQAHADCGGKGVGAVGMCFTGGYALAMMTEPSVVAPVLSQPSMPIAPKTGSGRAAFDCSAAEIACARRRFIDEDLSMIGLRFKTDELVPDERFARYKAEFGDRFEGHEFEDADAKPAFIPPHSVLTLHLADDGPTKAAEQRVIQFFKERTGAP
ncbi:MAG: dienelactone hydrolase family protein [Phenylobacterium sp.]|uniref:dienelactone hydrolase family protein n=1 Tax=Phenylobacterium sp. TaxID=1871053 RepID=UPI001A43A263|nr:dienelactone hydrolase family protein [Phenylobacterium sp.]MBL8553733.1 dienelactone hydrolase family protein [Phenylobacterium sp.]